MRLLLTSMLILLVSTGGAQIVVGRQVIGAAAVNGATSSTLVNSNTGEVAVQQYAGNTIALTEGFEQPADFTPLTIAITVQFEECWNGNNAYLEFNELSGCGGNYEVTVESDGLEYDANALPEGEFELTITAAGGCSVTQPFTVELPAILPCDLSIPNTITPNGDFVNDHLDIYWISFDEYRINHFTLVNRWGQLVWEGENYDNQNVVFDGNDLDGNQLPVGVYYFTLEYEGGSVNGHINLLR